METTTRKDRERILLWRGDNIFTLMNFCYNANPRLTKENSILEFNEETKEWCLYQKNKQNNETKQN